MKIAWNILLILMVCAGIYLAGDGYARKDYAWTQYLDEATVKGAKVANLMCNSELKACTYTDAKLHMKYADTVVDRIVAQPLSKQSLPSEPISEKKEVPIIIKKSMGDPSQAFGDAVNGLVKEGVRMGLNTLNDGPG